jgi:hypothetical protein
MHRCIRRATVLSLSLIFSSMKLCHLSCPTAKGSCYNKVDQTSLLVDEVSFQISQVLPNSIRESNSSLNPFPTYARHRGLSLTTCTMLSTVISYLDVNLRNRFNVAIDTYLYLNPSHSVSPCGPPPTGHQRSFFRPLRMFRQSR